MRLVFRELLRDPAVGAWRLVCLVAADLAGGLTRLELAGSAVTREGRRQPPPSRDGAR
jgi:hypothetical protein